MEAAKEVDVGDVGSSSSAGSEGGGSAWVGATTGLGAESMEHEKRVSGVRSCFCRLGLPVGDPSQSVPRTDSLTGRLRINTG